ncbi:methyl-accepting chemotaxis protein (MCP) signaling protein [Lachnotalea glycerini]|uniref:Chemotaxis protein n=1 Tax=Lachnotalea glycerini TaxID=1763509 RepID=A0A318EWH4_9FIRM|nr:methyl-accepting chemotaxis protein [Lachnotalea glycerini]PXV95404.1 methyl-accepting chemotaxis protein (MCP) signaling protein [Lachnotalea glycerini]RDY32725.1 chemotaxis protein [Lachnotalea glycerini]
MGDQNIIIEKLVEAFKNLQPYLKILFESEVSVAITDQEKFVYVNYCDKLDLKSQSGDLIPAGGAIRDALNNKREVIKEVPKQVYGTPFKSFAIPVKDANNVIGIVVFGKSLEKKNSLTGITKEVVDSLTEMSGAINHIAEAVQSLALMNEELLVESNKTNDQVEEIKNVVKVVEAIASQTNLLGLNAAIEAARAGENGRGFSIVAQEIRNLSNSSSESMKKIREVIDNITKSTQSINGKIVQFNDISQNQSASLEEMAASITEINNTSKLLEDIGNSL